MDDSAKILAPVGHGLIFFCLKLKHSKSSGASAWWRGYSRDKFRQSWRHSICAFCVDS